MIYIYSIINLVQINYLLKNMVCKDSFSKGCKEWAVKNINKTEPIIEYYAGINKWYFDELGIKYEIVDEPIGEYSIKKISVEDDYIDSAWKQVNDLLSDVKIPYKLDTITSSELTDAGLKLEDYEKAILFTIIDIA